MLYDKNNNIHKNVFHTIMQEGAGSIDPSILEKELNKLLNETNKCIDCKFISGNDILPGGISIRAYCKKEELNYMNIKKPYTFSCSLYEEK